MMRSAILTELHFPAQVLHHKEDSFFFRLRRTYPFRYGRTVMPCYIDNTNRLSTRSAQATTFHFFRVDWHPMVRLARILAVFLLLTGTAGTIVVVWIALPYYERRWTFSPAQSAVTDRRKMPADVVDVAFPTSDGLRLAGFFLDGAESRNGITILALHGSRGELIEYIPAAQTLQALGFNVLLFYFRGFGNSEGTSLGEETLNLDGEAALRYLVQGRGIDPESIAFLGISLGAVVAANLAASSPCRAVALVGAFASAKDQAKRFKPWIPAFVFNFLSSPLDTIAAVEEANCPVLIIHGEKDPSVPLEQAKAIYDAARPPKRLLVIPNAEHTMSDLVISSFLGDLASFFVRTARRR